MRVFFQHSITHVNFENSSDHFLEKFVAKNSCKTAFMKPRIISNEFLNYTEIFNSLPVLVKLPTVNNIYRSTNISKCHFFIRNHFYYLKKSAFGVFLVSTFAYSDRLNEQISVFSSNTEKHWTKNFEYGLFKLQITFGAPFWIHHSERNLK